MSYFLRLGGFEGGEGDEDDHVLCQGSRKRVCRA